MIYAVAALLAVAMFVGIWRVGALRRPSASTGSEGAPAVEAWAEAGTPEVLVANLSSSPVHEVRAYVALGRMRRPTCVGWIRTLPPTGEAARVALTADSRESWLRWADRGTRDSRDVAVEVTFRDQAGRRWHRDRSGALTAIKR